jgi:surface antigen
MAFVYWCVQEAAKAKGVPNPLFRTAGVLRQARERKSLSSKVPKVGSIFIMNYGGGLGHTGFVEKIEGEWVVTVEGNTDGSGSRTGGQVMRQRRRITSIQEFLYI